MCALVYWHVIANLSTGPQSAANILGDTVITSGGHTLRTSNMLTTPDIYVYRSSTIKVWCVYIYIVYIYIHLRVDRQL